MIHNPTTRRGHARLIMTTLLLGAVHSALADTSGATACDVHAAAMVAEMRECDAVEPHARAIERAGVCCHAKVLS